MSVEFWSLDSLVESYMEHQRRTRGLREQSCAVTSIWFVGSSALRWVTIRSTLRI